MADRTQNLKQRTLHVAHRDVALRQLDARVEDGAHLREPALQYSLSTVSRLGVIGELPHREID